MKFEKNKNYSKLLVLSYSLLGICFPATVTQFSLVIEDISGILQVGQDVILLADTFRAICLVIAMFASTLIYKKIGLKGTMVLGIFFQISPQFLIPLAINMNSLPLLFLFKGMQGANAMAFPLYIYSISLWVDSKYLGLATAIFNGSFVAGSGIGAFVSSLVIPQLGWEMSFYVIGIACLVFAIPALIMTKDKTVARPLEKHEKINTNKKANSNQGVLKNPITWALIFALVGSTWISQAITVDMPVYMTNIGYDLEESGNLMLIMSVVTIVASILSGYISDVVANKSENKVRARTIIMGSGYILSILTGFFLPLVSNMGFVSISLAAAGLMFGASWVTGSFWAIPSLVYSKEDNVAGTAFCSGASNIPNPIAPFVVGVMLGSNGMWTLGWHTCAITSIISVLACLIIVKKSKNSK